MTYNPVRNLLVRHNICHTTSYMQCDLSAGTCMTTAEWSAPLAIDTPVVSWGPQGTYVDSRGGLWMSGGRYCPPSADCTQLASWRKGEFHASFSGFRVDVAHMFEIGSKLYFMSGSHNDGWLAGMCDWDLYDCGEVTGGIFTHLADTFQTGAGAVLSNTWVARAKLIDGVFYMSHIDGHTRFRKCVGTFADCKQFDSPNWQALSRPAIGLSSMNELNDRYFWLDHENNFVGVAVGTDVIFHTIDRLD